MAYRRTVHRIALIVLSIGLMLAPSLALTQDFDICGPGPQPKSEDAAVTCSLFRTLTPVRTGIATSCARNFATAEMILEGMMQKTLAGFSSYSPL